MVGKNFKLYATTHITDAYCECGKELNEVSNGFLSRALYCTKCENVYLLELRKAPKNKITKEFLRQCKSETKNQLTNLTTPALDNRNELI